MAVWICRECTAAYAPDAPDCPHCRANDPIKETEQLQRELEAMPKNSVHMGSSNAVTGEGMPEPEHSPDAEAEQAPVEQETAEVPDDSSADARELYESETVTALAAELERRGLPKSGTKSELVDRLLEDDAARAAEAEDAEAEKDAG